MPLKRAAAAVAATKRIRESSSVSALSSDDTQPVKAPLKRTPVKKAAKTDGDAAEVKKPKVVRKKVEKVDGEEGAEPKAKTPRAAPKSKGFPPPELHPSTFRERQGLPAFTFPADAETHNPSPDTIDAGKKAPMHLGAHVSAAGGVAFSHLHSARLGAGGFALFLKNQRQWVGKPYETEEVDRFRKLMVSKDLDGLDHAADYILPHGSYLINLGNPDVEKRKKSYECFVDDLKRCEQLGLKLYNWHPGSTVGSCTHEEACGTIADSINAAHKEVGGGVVCVLENMANANSNIVGWSFSHLRDIIAKVDDKSRVGVCLDTCHMFAAGYDIRTPVAYAQTMKEFDDIVGFKYLRGMHMNDSKADFQSGRDLHENIGLGKIGLDAFRAIMRDSRLQHIPLILETPKGKNDERMKTEELEIEMLFEIQKIEDAAWTEKKVEIEKRWRAARDEITPQVEKVIKKKPAKKGKKAVSEEAESSQEE